MRTTLILEDTVFEKAKRNAAAAGITLSEFISSALKKVMMAQPQSVKKTSFVMPVFGGEGVIDYSPEELARLRDEGR